MNIPCNMTKRGATLYPQAKYFRQRPSARFFSVANSSFSSNLDRELELRISLTWEILDLLLQEDLWYKLDSHWLKRRVISSRPEYPRQSRSQAKTVFTCLDVNPSHNSPSHISSWSQPDPSQPQRRANEHWSNDGRPLVLLFGKVSHLLNSVWCISALRRY